MRNVYSRDEVAEMLHEITGHKLTYCTEFALKLDHTELELESANIAELSLDFQLHMLESYPEWED